MTDASGSVVAAAVVTLPAAGRTTITDQTGAFRFSPVPPGTWSVTIGAPGFTERRIDVTVVPGENPPLPPVVLEVAPAISKVDVGLTQKELATEQVHAEEKQRLLAIFPNFFVAYPSNSAPLTTAQKFQLGWKTIIDPEVLISTAIGAGIGLARNSVENLRSEPAATSRQIHFVLVKDLDVNSVVVAKAGAEATGEVTYTTVPAAAPGSAGEIRLSLENVRLRIGKAEVPLRSTTQKGVSGSLDYHWAEDSGRIALALYTAQNALLPPAQ